MRLPSQREKDFAERSVLRFLEIGIHLIVSHCS
jgi:hypothetical protein